MIMGAFGSGIYDNDDALELVADVTGGGGLETLVDALERVLEVEDQYLEVPEAAQGLAAADIVSRLRGRNIPADTGLDELAEWLDDVDFFVGQATVDMARSAVARIVQKPSELVELWTESGSLHPGWAAAVSRIVLRLE